MTGHDNQADRDAARLVELGSMIEGWRLARRMNYAELRRATDGLVGSDRQWGRVRDGQLEGLDTAAWLPRYESAWALLEARADTAEGEPAYDDLRLPRALRAAVAGAMRETGLARAVICTAPSGMGKSTAARMVTAKLQGRAVEAVADPSWSKPSAMLGGMAKALGVREPPSGESAALQAVVDILCSGRRAVFLDEAHHLSARTVNYVIALINRTPGEFVLLSIPTLWRKLEQSAWEECRQLTRNRLHERIVMTTLGERDAALVIERRCPVLAGHAKACAKAYCAGGEAHNLALLGTVCREANRLMEGDDSPGPGVFAEALGAVRERR